MLGDAVERALEAVGITKDRVERFVGGPCGCEERRQKLNALHAWAAGVLSGRTEGAERYLERLTEQER